MRAEKQTVAFQFPYFFLPEYRLYAPLLFFVSKVAVFFCACFFGGCCRKDNSRMALMVGNDPTL